MILLKAGLLSIAASPHADAMAPLVEAICQGDVILTPQDAADAARAVGPEIMEARHRTEAARARRSGVQTGLYPELEVSFRLSRLELEESSGSSDLAFDIPRDRASLRGVVSYSPTALLLDVLPRLDAEAAAIRAREWEEVVARQDLELRAKEAFWEVIRSKGVYWVAESSLEEARTSRDRLLSLSQVGLATPSDLASAEARVKERIEELLAAGGDWEIAREDLGLLMAREIPKGMGTARANLGPPTAVASLLTTLEAEAEQQRGELLVLDMTKEELTHRRRALIERMLPSLSLEAEALYAQPNPNLIPPEDDFSGSVLVGPVVAWSPNLLASAAADRAELDAERARVGRERARVFREIRFDIRRQTNALRVSLRRLGSTEERVKAAGEAFRTRQVAFENGRALYSELLGDEAELNRARLASLFALVDAHLARARLNRALGRRMN